MKSPDDTVLRHRTPYDPVKAHEYYMRTRQLKGRKKGAGTYTVNYNGRTVVLSAKELAEQKAYAAKRVAQIKIRLAELKTKIRQAIGETKQKKVKAKREAEKSPTRAEKSKAARESKQYRDKHKTELNTKARVANAKSSGTSSSKTGSGKDKAQSDARVQKLVDKLIKVNHTLNMAVDRQRALAGATKNR